MTTFAAKRHPELLVAPFVTVLALVLMLVTAHFYERLPAQLPDCGFKTNIGVPCAACGGTRSMKALSHGEPGAALRFHPFFTVSVLAAPIWLAIRIRKFFVHSPVPSLKDLKRQFKLGVIIFSTLLLINWVYLIFFLP